MAPASVSELNSEDVAEDEDDTAEFTTENSQATPTEAVTPTPAPPTPTPLPPKEMTICMGAAPENVYLYGDASLPAQAIRHAIYESPFTTLAYDYQPQALTKLPNLADGDARITTVEVEEGDLIVNSAGNVVFLLPGVQIETADGELVVFERPDDEAEPLLMQQMVVDFTFRPLVWSDGAPVTAADSVFSFEVAAAPDTPGSKAQIDRTASYEATGDLSLRWTGLPGFLDPNYFTNVWTPLPRHQLQEYTAVELLVAPEVAQMPLSHGPFVVEAWEDDQMRLARNPNYYRLSEGLPHIGQMTVRFGVEGEATALIADGCDIITQDAVDLAQTPALQEAEEAGELTPHFQTNTVFEHIDFGINSFENYGDGNRNGRPDWFEDVRVRQAMTMCTNRQQMIDELMYGHSPIMHAYIPDSHPLYPEDAQSWDFDVAEANRLLDEVGLEDTDGDGVRELVERDIQNSIVATTTMSITLGTDDVSAVRRRINELFTVDMEACGIQVNLYEVPAEDWYADGPFSPLFGRRFDLATFAWRTNIQPPCSLYLSSSVTGPEERGFGGWNNVNATGWADEAYDAACEAAQAALPGTDAFRLNHQEAVRIFTRELPTIPLFSYVKVAVTSPAVRNFALDVTEPSELWNVYEIDIVETDG